MSIVLARPETAFEHRAKPRAPPIQWVSAGVGLVLAIALVVTVSWLASYKGGQAVPNREPIVVGATLAGPTPIPPPATAQAAPLAPPPQVKVANTRGLGVNLRVAANERATRVKTLPEGAQLEIIGEDMRDGGMVWRNVRDASGTVGWVAGTFVLPATAGR